MKHDTDVRDTDSDPAAEGRDPVGQPVNTSRRRFTRAGLSASAVMTLASRPALANFCSHSGTMSGNTSQAGMPTCHGLPISFWMDETEWMNLPFEPGIPAEPGMCNPITYVGMACSDYEFILAGDLETANNDPNIMIPLDRYTTYRAWAGWDDNTPPSTPQAASPAPTFVSDFFPGNTMIMSAKTVMQEFWTAGASNSVVAQASAAALNIKRFGAASFGYTISELNDFISSWSNGPSALLAALTMLNTRG